MRTKITTGIVATALAAGMALSPASAQEVGAPEHIGRPASSSSEMIMQSVPELSSPDKYTRMHGQNQLLSLPIYMVLDVLKVFGIFL